MTTDSESFFDSSLYREIERRQNNGASVYVWGLTEDRQRALLVDPDADAVRIAHRLSANTIGRWECTPQHLSDYFEVYRAQFPVLPHEADNEMSITEERQ